MKNQSKNLKNVAIVIACFAVCMTLAMTGCKKDKKDDNGGSDANLTGIKFEKSTVTIKVGESATLKVVPIPSDAKLPKCNFSSEDKDIATVDGNGKVSAIAEGETTITVTTSDGKFNAECTVKVTKTGGGGNATLTGIKFDKDNITLEVGESTTVKVLPIPSDAELPKLSVLPDDIDILWYDISNGEITGLKEGETKIIAITLGEDEFMAECKVKVKKSGTVEDIFKEPCLNFGASMETIKTCETRVLEDEYYFILKYKGENDEVEGVDYYFEDDKMSSVNVKLFNKNNMGKRLVTFLSSKYRFLMKLDDETYGFETLDGKIAINLSYFAHTDNWDVSYMESIEKGFNDNLSRFNNSNNK